MCTSSWCLSSIQCKNGLSGHVRHILWGVERVFGAFISKCNNLWYLWCKSRNFRFYFQSFQTPPYITSLLYFFNPTGQRLWPSKWTNIIFFIICIPPRNLGSLVTTWLFRVLNLILFNETILPFVNHLTMTKGNPNENCIFSFSHSISYT